jgi:putative aldouronate transport system permease protein
MKDSFLGRVVKNKAFLIMLIPGVVYILVLAYIPMGGIILAFKK